MKKLISLSLLPFLVTACATLESVGRPVPPEVTLREVSLRAMDFSRAELVAEFHVANPNAVAVDLSGRRCTSRGPQRGPQLEYRLEAGALVRPDFELLLTVEIRPILTGSIPISR